MSRKKDMVLVAAGLLTGLTLAGPAGAAVEQLTATRSACPIYVDGQKVELEAYMINDQNYVKLRDIGQAVSFNVYWDGSAAQVESDKPYTGQPPVKEEALTPETIRVGSWNGTELEVGDSSVLTFSEDTKDCTVVSSDTAVVTLQEMFGYWVMTAKGPGVATVTVTGPEGRTGSITVTVKPATPTEQEPLVIPDPEPYSEMRLELVRLVNEARKANGVGELAINDALMNAAQICSARERSWHNSKEDCETVLACGYPHGFGSNITAFTSVADAETAQRAVTNWLNSPGHRDTMLGPDYDTIGVGITESSRGATFCFLFVGNPNTHNPYGTD